MNLTNKDNVMLYEEWIEKYQPIENTIVDNPSFEPYGFETFGKEIEFVKQKQIKNIWTVVDGGSSEFWITPGFRFVNRFAYMITAIPWEGEPDNVFLGDKEDYENFLKETI